MQGSVLVPTTLTQYFQIVISTYVGPDGSLITFFLWSHRTLQDSFCHSTYGIILSNYLIQHAASSPSFCLFFCCLPSSSAIYHLILLQ